MTWYQLYIMCKWIALISILPVIWMSWLSGYKCRSLPKTVSAPHLPPIGVMDTWNSWSNSLYLVFKHDQGTYSDSLINLHLDEIIRVWRCAILVLLYFCRGAFSELLASMQLALPFHSLLAKIKWCATCNKGPYAIYGQPRPRIVCIHFPPTESVYVVEYIDI